MFLLQPCKENTAFRKALYLCCYCTAMLEEQYTVFQSLRVFFFLQLMIVPLNKIVTIEKYNNVQHLYYFYKSLSVSSEFIYRYFTTSKSLDWNKMSCSLYKEVYNYIAYTYNNFRACGLNGKVTCLHKPPRFTPCVSLPKKKNLLIFILSQFIQVKYLFTVKAFLQAVFLLTF